MITLTPFLLDHQGISTTVAYIPSDVASCQKEKKSFNYRTCYFQTYFLVFLIRKKLLYNCILPNREVKVVPTAADQ